MGQLTDPRAGPPVRFRAFHTLVAELNTIVTELRRRHVFQIAAGYAAIAFVLIQLADLTYTELGFPPWAYRATVYAVLAAAPIVLVLAWVYDITSEGIRKTAPLESASHSGSVQATYSPRSVAILPFANLSADPENEYFSDGITEDIIARVSRIRNLKVISRTSVMQYKNTEKGLREIGRDLGVAAILEGSVRRIGDRVRIVAQLVDARTDAHRWAETYDRVLEDIFLIQTDVANHIALALQAELSPQELEHVSNRPTESLEAYDLYLRARHEWNRRTADALEQSVILHKQALELDSRFALAWAGLADSLVILGVYGARAPADVMPAAREAAEQALRINPTLGEALTSLANYHVVYDYDVRSAARAFQAAMELNPQYTTAPQWYAMNVLVPQGKFEDAELLMQRACELDPISPVMTMSLGILEYYKRDYTLAHELCTDVLSLHPGFRVAHYWMGLALVQLGRLDEAITALGKSIDRAVWSTEATAGLAHACALANRTSEAEILIRSLQAESRRRYVSPSFVAQAHLALGDKERALALLTEARQVHAADLIWIGVRPTFDPLREDPRFQKLVASMELTPQ